MTRNIIKFAGGLMLMVGVWAALFLIGWWGGL